MSVKLLLLKSGEQLIADTMELISNSEEQVETPCGYLLKNPHRIEYKKPVLLLESREDAPSDGEIQISLSPWLILSMDEQIPIRFDYVVTVVEPVKTLVDLYEEKINGQNDQVSFTEEQSCNSI